jgi:hypothetical protein
MLKKARDNGRRKSLVEELHSKQYYGLRFEAGHTSVSSGNTGLIPQYYQHKQQKTAMGKEADDEQVREQVATLLMTLKIETAAVGKEGSHARSLFTEDLSTDLAVAVCGKGDSVHDCHELGRASCFKIRNVVLRRDSSFPADIAILSRLLPGNVIVEIAVCVPRREEAGASAACAWVAASSLAGHLLQQCADEVSPLRKGRSPPASLRACASYVLD